LAEFVSTVSNSAESVNRLWAIYVFLLQSVRRGGPFTSKSCRSPRGDGIADKAAELQRRIVW